MDELHGDMPAEEFRRYGYRVIDWASDYLKNIEKYEVLSSVKPGEIKSRINEMPPAEGESMDRILEDFNKIVMPGITHWNHPGFMAYFNSTSGSPGILAELITASLNVNGMLWITSPAVTELERVMLNWLKRMLALPDDFWGIIYDTASVSTMHAIAAAREQAYPEIRGSGMTGRNDLHKLILYASEHAHSSVEKSALTLGIGIDGLRKIPVDSKFRMDVTALDRAIEEDLAAGHKPFCVVATVGTTSTTSVDPLEEIASVTKKHKLWLHVDGAYGGTAAVLPEMRWILNGIEHADSFVINPHKWMFTPIDLSAFYTRKPDVLKRAFSLIPEYLKTNSDSDVENLMDYGIQLGRRFRALKLWFIIRYFGVNGIMERIREHIRLAGLFKEIIENNPEFEIMAPAPMSVICFRAKPQALPGNELDKFNSDLLNNINSRGEIFLSHTKLSGKYVIRLAVSSIRHQEHHILRAAEIISEELSNLKIKFYQ